MVIGESSSQNDDTEGWSERMNDKCHAYNRDERQRDCNCKLHNANREDMMLTLQWEECERNIEDNISGEIELSMLEQFRKTFPVQNDADPFEIKQN